MTHVMRVTNVNRALDEALWHLKISGKEEQSRNGPVLVAPGPVLTEYTRPWERVLFCQQRNANPFFHLMESLWMLAGRNDLAFVSKFNFGMKQYSDDGGVTQPAAYGHRWRTHFKYDQLAYLIELLKKGPNTRRAVLGMWDAAHDLRFSFDSADLPCNTHAYVDLRGGKLNLAVMCRSNDALWGAYGANAVHFTFLQEWLAAAVGVPMGIFYQYSYNLHIYNSACGGVKPQDLAEKWVMQDEYAAGCDTQELVAMDEDADLFLLRCENFCRAPNDVPMYQGSDFLVDVAKPMWDSWEAYKNYDKDTSLEAANEITAEDWSLACVQWLHRAWGRRDAKSAD